MSTCETEGPLVIDRLPRVQDSSPRAQESAPVVVDLPLAVQLVRYLFVGGVAFLADFGALFVLTDACHLHYLQSSAIAFLIGTAVNYALSVAWVFKVRVVKSTHVEFLLFALIGLVGLGMNQLLIWTLTDGLNLFYLHAKLITTALILGWNFGAHKLLLFTSSPSGKPREMVQI